MNTTVASLIGVGLIAIAAPTEAAWEIDQDTSEIFDRSNHILEMADAPDGQGGMFLAIAGQDLTPRRVSITRIDHTGTEAWGEGGVLLPIEIDALYNSRPVRLAPDGTGGVYVAYQAEKIDDTNWIRLAHLTSSGALDWGIPVQNLGNISDASEAGMSLEVVAASNGEPIVVWQEFTPTEKIRAARFTLQGTLLWVTDVNTFGRNFIAVPDGADGLFVGWHDFAAPFSNYRVQRVTGAGTPLWGADGVAAWTGFGGEPQLLADAAGGVYTLVTDQGQARGKHLDASGTDTWGAGATGKLLQDTQTAFPFNETYLDVCSDGNGGLLLVQGRETIFAQHVDVAGNLLWGTNGTTLVARGGLYNLPVEGNRIASDGFGGAVIAYEDSFDPGGIWCRVIWRIRVDAFGTMLWNDYVTGCEYATVGGTPELQYEPREPCVVGDGSGGGLYAWFKRDVDVGPEGIDVEVWAHGTDPNGNPPTPRLVFLAPDGATPTSTNDALVVGDYLDSSLQYVVTRPGEEIALTNLSTITHQLVGGTLDLVGAPVGAYDVIVRQSGADRDTLEDALGVGPTVPCDADGPFLTTNGVPQSEGNPRAAAYDGAGRLHVTWVEYDDPNLAFHLYHRVRDGDTWQAPELVFSQPASAGILSPVLAVSPENDVYLTCIVREPDGRTVLYLFVQPGGDGITAFADLVDDGVEKRAPTIVAEGGGTTHVVYETGASGASALVHATFQGGGFVSSVTMASGTNATEPDLVKVGTGPNADLFVTFVRNSWFPGLREVCYQRFDGTGGTWAVPQLLDFGIQAKSPTAAFDGADILFGWILDNGIGVSQPWLRSRSVAVPSETMSSIGARLSDGLVYTAIAASDGPGSFYFLTLESDGGFPITVYVRKGNGTVFYPKRRINANADVWFPILAVENGGNDHFAMWQDYTSSTEPLFAWECRNVTVDAPAGVPDIPLVARLSSAPNPFNPTTTIAFVAPRTGRATLSVYDVSGRRVRTLYDGPLGAGDHEIRWDGRDDARRPLASGVYVARLEVPGESTPLRMKLVLLK